MSVPDEIRQRIVDRMEELEPLVEEYHQLNAIAQALEDRNGAAGSRRRTAVKPSRSRRSRDGRRRRPHGTGERSAQALALVRAQPGITIPEMGRELGISPNYLYRVLPKLAEDGKVKKVGKGWEAIP